MATSQTTVQWNPLPIASEYMSRSVSGPAREHTAIPQVLTLSGNRFT
jgi:hypothetical protein